MKIFSLYLSLVFLAAASFFSFSGIASAEVGSAGLVPCGTTPFVELPKNPTTEQLTAAKEKALQIAEECQFEHLIALAQKIMNYLLFYFAIPFAAILFAWAGFLYLTSAGDMNRVKSAHTIFKNVVIGLVLALAAWLIVKALITGLGVANIQNFLG